MNTQKIINKCISKNFLKCSNCRINYTSKLERPHFPYKYTKYGLVGGKQIKYDSKRPCPRCGGKPE